MIFKRKIGKFSILLMIVFMFLNFLSCSEETKITEEINNKITNAEVIKPSTVSNSIFIYNKDGIARYVYNELGKISEIVTLDPLTMTEYISEAENLTCKYTYDANGNITELIYLGKKFIIDNVDEIGRPTSAICETVTPAVSVRFTYGDNNVITKEEFSEGGVVVLVNSYDNDGRPILIDYTSIGSLSYEYSNNEVYVTVKNTDPTQSSPGITLYTNESGYPYAFLQSFENAMTGYSWAYDDNMLCTNTVVETVYDSQRFSEEYVLIYNEQDLLSKVMYYTYNSENVPIISKHYAYEYDEEGNATFQTDTTLDEDGNVKNKLIYKFINGKRFEYSTEEYNKNSLTSKNTIDRIFDESNREISITYSNYLGDGTLASVNVSDYEYDVSGLVSKRTTKAYDDKNELQHNFVEEYSYNKFGRKEFVTYTVLDPTGILIEKETDSFEYDENGNVVNQTALIFDAGDNLVNKIVTLHKYSDTGKLESTTVTTYDSTGNIIKVENK